MWGWNNKLNRENSQNAYILVYEKREKHPVQLEFTSHAHLEEATLHYGLPKPVSVEPIADGKLQVNMGYNDLVAFVPDNLKTQVIRDN
jgi:hypothetical protein